MQALSRPAPPRGVRVLAPVLLALALAVTQVAGPSAAAGQSLGLAQAMRDTVLDNGLHVIVVPNPTIPLATIQVTIRNGAFTQLTEADTGVPHLLEHMLFRSFGGGSGFAGEAYKLDAIYNGTTGDETVTYYITLPSPNLDRGIRLMADLMRQPRFRDADLTAEKQVVRGELERLAGSPEFLLDMMVDRAVWGSGWPRRNAIGNALSIQATTAAKLREVYQRFYVPNNAAVVITGDVAPDAAFASAARHFARWGRSADPFATLVLPPMPLLQSSQQMHVEADANDVTFLIRWPGPNVGADVEATYAADVFASLVADPLSPIQMRLVDSGLFQSVSMWYSTLAHGADISLHARTTADQIVEASAALRAEIDRFGDEGYVTEEAITIAKKKREVDWAMFMETPSGLASFIGEMWSVAGLDYTRGYLPALQMRSVADVEAFIARYLTDRPRVTGIMVSQLTRRQLGPALQTALAHWRD